MSTARRCAAFGIVALFALQIVWHGWWLPPERATWLVVGWFVLPIAPALLLLLLRHRQAIFWGSVAALLYFCHGVMDAWSDADARLPALIEVVLSVWLIVTGSWDGMRARFARKS